MWLARVQDLTVYPLKSARGIGRQEVAVDPRGLRFDRHWLLAADALQLGPRGPLPRLTIPVPAKPVLRLVDIWSHRGNAEDCGDEAARWCSTFLGETVRLVHAGHDLARCANPDITPGEIVPVAFADGYPILVTNQASLDDLSRKMGAALTMNAFRPNIVLSGLPPWAEDQIERVEMGPVTLRLCKPCTRCVIPSIDQTTGLPGPDPTPTLKHYRWNKALRGVTFGENAYAQSGFGATLRVGMEARCYPRSADNLGRA
jgi:uncharacterized protein